MGGKLKEHTSKRIEYHIYLSFFFLLFFKAAHRWPMDGASERRRELKGSIGKERERERESVPADRSACRFTGDGRVGTAVFSRVKRLFRGNLEQTAVSYWRGEKRI